MNDVNINNNVAVCVTGWYYPIDFYTCLAELHQADVYVVSHKSRSEVPRGIYELIPRENFMFKPNIGYDWGCYQQFISEGLWQNYEYIIFMHDDLLITDKTFIEKTIELLNTGKKFVGNGINNKKTDWARDYYYVYAPLGWKPPSSEFRHETLRGSFVATTREALERINNFEVFWDWLHLNVKFGNWSLITTCGKIESIFGKGCFGFLGDEYCKSDYLIEKVRGGIKQKSSSLIIRIIIDSYVEICKWYMKVYLNSKENLVLRLIKPLLCMVSGGELHGLCSYISGRNAETSAIRRWLIRVWSKVNDHKYFLS